VKNTNSVENEKQKKNNIGVVFWLAYRYIYIIPLFGSRKRFYSKTKSTETTAV